MPRWTPLNSRSLAEDGRETLENVLAGAMKRALRTFLADVEADARAALESPVVLAAGVPEPFTLSSVQRHWKKATKKVVNTLREHSRVGEEFLAAATTRMEQSALPSLAYSSVRSVLSAAVEGRWPTPAIFRAIGDALSFTTGSTEQVGPSETETKGVNWEAVAEMHARTEATAAWSDAALTRMIAEGVKFKQWSAVGDDHTRPEHLDADGQIVPVDQPFNVGGEELMYPGDPAGSTAMTANCRCVTIEGLDIVP